MLLIAVSRQSFAVASSQPFSTSAAAAILSHALAWSVWLPFMLVLIAMQAVAAGIYFRVRPRLDQLRQLTNASRYGSRDSR